MAPAPRPAFSDERSRMTAFLPIVEHLQVVRWRPGVQNIRSGARRRRGCTAWSARNGSGKSTLIKIIAGILRARRGRPHRHRRAGASPPRSGATHRLRHPGIIRTMSRSPNLTVRRESRHGAAISARRMSWHLGEGSARRRMPAMAKIGRGARSRCDRRRALDLGPPARGDLPRAIGQPPGS